MPIPDPEPGLVIRYDYLWSREANVGRESGKDRPACLVAASEPSADPRFIVLLPITYSPPTEDDVAVELPREACKALGLDNASSWVVISDHNVDNWPCPGLQALPGQPRVFAYGFLPPRIFSIVRKMFLDLIGQSGTTGVRRWWLEPLG